jgi:nitrogen fixation/metabolism regulation signal transduction histidine kinase
MKSKVLFWILAFPVFGSLIFTGFLFLKSDIRKVVLVEILAVLAIIFFIVMYQRLIKPYRIISDGMELLKAQDFSTRLRSVSDSETDKLIEIFNKMMDQLKDERLQVREKNKFLDLLIQASPQGVIILDFDDKITEINPAGLRLLNIKDINTVAGKTVTESGIDIAGQLSRLKPDNDIIIRASGTTIFRCVRSSFIDRGFAHPFILIEELTHELMKAERESYENIVRMMAHEVNNSIGAVGSTLNVISDILRQNEDSELTDVLPAVEASFERCRHLGRFINDFAEVVKIPEPTRSNVGINELAIAVKSLTHIECRRRNITLTLSLTTEKDTAYIDSIQFEQVLVNIVKNAYEAIGADGNIHIITHSDPLSVIVENDGPPIPEDIKKQTVHPLFHHKTGRTGNRVDVYPRSPD